MKNITTQKLNEYTFLWGKQLKFLTLRTSNTRLMIHNTTVIIEMEHHYLGFIKGKSTTMTVGTDQISDLSTKNMLSLSDLLVAALFFTAGFFNPLFFIIVPISVWASMNTNIIISTKENKKIRIPSHNIKDANHFIHYIKDVYIEA